MEQRALEFAVLDVETGLVGSNGNSYIQFSIRQKGDLLARVRKWNFFADEDTLEAVEKDCPKSLWFADVRVKTPMAYYRRWEQEPGNGQQAGDYVCTKAADGSLQPLIFDDIKVLVRWANATTPSQEDPQQLMTRAWNRGLSNGSIEPIEESGNHVANQEPVKDILAGGTGDENVDKPNVRGGVERGLSTPTPNQRPAQNGFRR